VAESTPGSCTWQLSYSVVFEPTAKNPYLSLFYEDPKKYALKLQVGSARDFRCQLIFFFWRDWCMHAFPLSHLFSHAPRSCGSTASAFSRMCLRCSTSSRLVRWPLLCSSSLFCEPSKLSLGPQIPIGFWVILRLSHARQARA
jgi:hypothetical protein